MTVTHRGVEFEEVVDAVDDLGLDPTGEEPIDEIILESFTRNILIDAPPGTYLVAGTLQANGLDSYPDPPRGWGIRGTGDSRHDVRITIPDGKVRRVFDLRDCWDVLVENLIFDQSTRDTAIGNVIVSTDNAKVHNVELVGFETQRGTKDLSVRATDPDGVAVVNKFVRVGGTEMVDYPDNEMGFHAGGDHRGTLELIDCHIDGAASNAIYASRTRGTVNVRGGLYRNCGPTHLRVSGEDSVIEDVTVVVDTDAPDFREKMEGNNLELASARGIWNECGARNDDFPYRDGPDLRRVDLVYKSCKNTNGIYSAHPDGGGHDAEGLRIHTEVDDDVIRLQDYSGDGEGTVEFNNLCLTGNLPDGHQVVDTDRELVIRDGCVDLPNDYDLDGATIDGDLRETAEDPAVEEPTWVDGIDPRTEEPVMPNEPDETDDSTDDGTGTNPDDGTDDPADDPLPVEEWQDFVVRADPRPTPDGSNAPRYTIEIVGDAEFNLDHPQYAPSPTDDPANKGEYIERHDDGTATITGIVANDGGDAYHLQGVPSDVQFHDGTGYVTIDGHTIPPEFFGPPAEPPEDSPGEDEPSEPDDGGETDEPSEPSEPPEPPEPEDPAERVVSSLTAYIDVRIDAALQEQVDDVVSQQRRSLGGSETDAAQSGDDTDGTGDGDA